MSAPKYRQALVSYVDILGFRQLVASGSVADVLQVLRGKNRLTLHWFNKKMPEEEMALEGMTFSFSDLIVNATPLDDPYLIQSLFDPLVTLGYRQFSLAIKGIFVRGGITFGDIYFDEQTIFGPALITAYDLERMTAKWPIIAIDPTLIKSIDLMAPGYIADRRQQEGTDGELCGNVFLWQLRHLINLTEEGVPFLDYISCFAYMDSTTGDLPYYLQDHRNSLLEAYKKHRHWKYPFLARYHDSYCRKHFKSNSTLIIGELV